MQALSKARNPETWANSYEVREILVSTSVKTVQNILERFDRLYCTKSAMLINHLQTTPPQMRPLAPHMWLLLVQVGVGFGTVVVGVLTVSVGSEGVGSVLGAGAVSLS
jgi:hypothetical protein